MRSPETVDVRPPPTCLPPIFRRLHQVSDCPRGERFLFPTTERPAIDSLQSVDRRRFPFRRYSYDEDGFLVVRTRNVNRDAYVGVSFCRPFYPANCVLDVSTLTRGRRQDPPPHPQRHRDPPPRLQRHQGPPPRPQRTGQSAQHKRLILAQRQSC